MLNHKLYNERPESQGPAIELIKKLSYKVSEGNYIPYYKYISHSDAEKQRGSLVNVILIDDLTEFLRRQTYNYKGREIPFSSRNIAKAIRDINVPLQMGLMHCSKEIYDMLIYGKSYEEDLYDGGVSSFDLKFIDWENPENNIFRVTEEFSVERPNKKHRRPDIVLTVNGLPLVVIECKSSQHDVEKGIEQNIKNWNPDEIPQLFKFAQLVIAMNTHTVKYGTCGTKKEFFVPWKEENKEWLEEECNRYISGRKITEQDKNIISLLSPERLLNLIKFFIIYDNGVKKIARYQQFFGIEKAMKRIKMEDGKGTKNGVIWHTQGSGKSLTMVMLVKKIIAESQKLDSDIKNPRFVLVNDRINLDKQLRDNFTNTQMQPARAKTGKGLIELLKDEGESLVTTVIHKFEKAAREKTKINSKNIFILIDECHRTQSGNFHNFMTDVLSEAVKIGFTGTPLLSQDKKDKQKGTYIRIGPLIDAYPIDKAEKDQVIRPLVYEGRKIPQKTTDEAINKYLEQLLYALNEDQQRDLKRKWSSYLKISQTDTRIKMVAFAVKEHFERFIKPKGFKAMVATSSRPAAIELYKIFKTINVKSAAVISPESVSESDNLDTNDKAKIAGFFKSEVEPMFGQNYEAYEEWAKGAFVSGEEIDVLVVKDKLLTGFDAPIAGVLYVDKKMEKHNLLQAIARVNRVYPGKDYGLIVDFRGVFEHLNTAMDMYTDTESGMSEFDREDIEGAISGCEDEKNKLEYAYRQLIDMFQDVDKDPESMQVHLKDEELRYEFYEKLSSFSNALNLAVSSYNIYSLIGIDKMKEYQDDFKSFQKLRGALKIRYSEAIDFSEYEPGIKNLLNMFVDSGADQIVVEPVFISDKEGMQAELAKLPSKRAQAEAIKTRLEKTITQKRDDDPIFYKTFKDMIDETLLQYNKDRNNEAYLANMEKMANDYRQGFVGKKYPECIEDDDKSKAFYGKLKLELDDIISIEVNNEADTKLGKLAIEIKNVIAKLKKTGWHTNTVVKNNMKQEVEDLIFDFIDEYNIELSVEKLDIIEQEIMRTAQEKFKNE